VFLKKKYILIFSALYKKYKIPKLAKICSIWRQILLKF
jgi:hypothetical protein